MRTFLNNLFGVLLGLVFVGVGLFQVYQFYGVAEHGVKTTGRVVDISSSVSKGKRMYSAVVEFEMADGKKQRFTDRFSSSIMPKIGAQQPVLYDPSSPRDALINSTFNTYFFPGMFIFMGALVVFLICFLPLIMASVRRRKAERLRSMGRTVQAQILDVIYTARKANSTVPSEYRISAQWLDTATNTVHVFQSFPLFFDPTSALGGRKEITVYMNPANPKDYWVDTSFLPKAAF